MSNKETVTVQSTPRLHFGLLDCGNATLRQFGGSGVAIDGLFTEVTATAADSWKLLFAPGLQASGRTADDANALIERLRTEHPPAHITVLRTAPEHMGLGSKTTLLLCIVAAYFAAIGKELTRHELVRLTKRGGTSGVGVNLFWEGGFIIDAGHATPAGSRTFAPSSARVPKNIPPVSVRHTMPETWRIALFYDTKGKNIEGKQERKIFAEAMPMPEIECLRASAATFQGILPGIIEQDLVTLAAALQTLNTVGMKAVELSYQSRNTQHFLRDAWENGLAAGLSSFGPCTFVIGEASSDALPTAKAFAETHHLVHMGTFPFNNKGMRRTEAEV